MFTRIWESLDDVKQRQLLALSLFQGWLNWTWIPWYLEELRLHTDLPDTSDAQFKSLRADLVRFGVLMPGSACWPGEPVAAVDAPSSRLNEAYKIHPLLKGFVRQRFTVDEQAKFEVAFGFFCQRLSATLLKKTYFEKDGVARLEGLQLLQIEMENFRFALPGLCSQKAPVRDVWGCIQLLLVEQRRFEDALNYGRQVIESLEMHGYDEAGMEFIQAKYNLATVYVWLHQYDTAREILDEVELQLGQTKEKDSNPKTVADLRMAIATVLQQNFDYQKSLSVLQKARDFYQESGHSADVLAATMAIGDVLRGLREFGVCKEEYDAAFRLAEELEDTANRAAILHGMGRLLEDTGDFAGADEKMNRALELQRPTKDHRNIGETLANLGANANRWGRFELARDYYATAINHFIQLGDREREGILYTNIGALGLYTRDVEDAIGYFGRAITIFEQLNGSNGRRLLANAMHNKGLAHYLGNAVLEGNRSLLDAFQFHLEFGERDQIVQIITHMMYVIQQMIAAKTFDDKRDQVERSLKTMDSGLAERFRVAELGNDFALKAWSSYCLSFLRYHAGRLGLLGYTEGADGGSFEFATHSVESYQAAGDDRGFGLASLQRGRLLARARGFDLTLQDCVASAAVFAKYQDETRLLETFQLLLSLSKSSGASLDSIKTKITMALHLDSNKVDVLFERASKGLDGAEPIQTDG